MILGLTVDPDRQLDALNFMNKRKDYENIEPWSKSEEKFGKWLIKKIGPAQTFVYEATGGRFWHTFLGAECAILTTTGNKTGKKRKTPLLYLENGDDIVMVASQAGFSTDPYWYKNLKKNPQATIQIGTKIRTMFAREATENEKLALWPQLDAIYEGYKEYRARAKGIREIPIVIFSDV